MTIFIEPDMSTEEHLEAIRRRIAREAGLEPDDELLQPIKEQIDRIKETE